MVTVCMATYNGSSYLREQVRSILRDLSPEDELIISDDGSSDDTCSIVESLGDPRIRLLHNRGHHGVNGNFSNALSNAGGEYIFLADQDDIWLPGKKEACVAALKKADLVLHDASLVDKDLKPQNKTLFYELKVKGGVFNNFLRNRFTGCCMAFRRDILTYVLPLPDTASFFHDSWIGLLVSIKGNVAIIPEQLILFRRHGGSNSSAGGRSRLSLLRKLSVRASLGYNIIKRICKG